MICGSHLARTLDGAFGFTYVPNLPQDYTLIRAIGQGRTAPHEIATNELHEFAAVGRREQANSAALTPADLRLDNPHGIQRHADLFGPYLSDKDGQQALRRCRYFLQQQPR